MIRGPFPNSFSLCRIQFHGVINVPDALLTVRMSMFLNSMGCCEILPTNTAIKLKMSYSKQEPLPSAKIVTLYKHESLNPTTFST